MNRHSKGFTLMEMLIVVSIITILVSASIPMLGYQLERSRKATCLANQESLKSLLMANFFTFRDPAKVNALFINSRKDSEGNENKGQDYTCPSGGEIYYLLDDDTGVVVTYCTKHNRRGADNVLETAAANIGEQLFLRENTIDQYVNIVDSNASGGAKKTTLVKDWLALNYVQLSYDDASTWKIVRQSKGNHTVSYIWSSYDISITKDSNGNVVEKGAQYSKIPAILYDGTQYYVGMTVVSVKEAGVLGKGDLYNEKYYFIADGADGKSPSAILEYPQGKSVADCTFATREAAEAYYYKEIKDGGELAPVMK